MKKLLSVTVVLLVVLSVLSWYVLSSRKQEIEEQPQSTQTTQEQFDQTLTDELPLAFEGIDFQSVVDAWVDGQSGSTSVYIADAENPDRPLVRYQENESYFAASLYKLFVVYEGYQSLDDGTYNQDEVYVAGQTRVECLDAAIRSSDSPCAEAWWVELGKEEITSQMQDLGMLNTSLTGITTTAHDTAVLLGLLWTGEGLSDQSRSLYLDSMLKQDQLYRRGLPSGFSDGVEVYNKVGWNLDQEWHDTSIVDFGDDRVLIVTVLTDGVGMNAIAELGSLIESAVLTE